jgi:hypothetical protein
LCPECSTLPDDDHFSSCSQSGAFMPLLPDNIDGDPRDYMRGAPPGVKHDGDKLRWDLLQWRAVEEVVGVITFGARKYSDDGWRDVVPLKRRYLSACFRHIRAWMRGEKLDPESERHHLAAAAFSLLAIVETELGEQTVLEPTIPARGPRNPSERIRVDSDAEKAPGSPAKADPDPDD